MKKFLVVFVAVCLLAGGCASKPTGSREFIPGQGWVPAK